MTAADDDSMRLLEHFEEGMFCANALQFHSNHNSRSFSIESSILKIHSHLPFSF